MNAGASAPSGARVASIVDEPYDRHGTPGRACLECRSAWPASEPDDAPHHHADGCMARLESAIHAAFAPLAADEPRPLSVHALDGAVRALNAESLARAAVAELRAQRARWQRILFDEMTSAEQERLAVEATAAIDGVVKP